MSLPDQRVQVPTLSSYLTTIRRSWWLILLCVIASLSAAVFYLYEQPPVYRATTKIVVGQGEGIFLPEVGNVAEQFTQTMSDLIESDVVAREVVDRLGLSTSPSELLEDLEVTTKPSTAVLEVSFDDIDRDRGLRTLQETGRVFTELVEDRLAPSPEQTTSGERSLAVTANIFDPAHMLPDPVWPRPIVTLAVAAFGGLAFGVLAALVRRQLDNTIRSIDHAEEIFGSAAIATLPAGMLGYRAIVPPTTKLRRRERRRRADPVLAELLWQRVASAVVWGWDPDKTRTIVVASSNPEEGKTTVAANVAVALARQGHIVLAVEADMRRATLATYLGTSSDAASASLEDVMGGRVPVQQAWREVRVGEGRLRTIVGATESNRLPQLRLEQATRLMEELSNHADFVIFDAPPTLIVTDAHGLIAAADVVLAIARKDRTSVSALETFARTLARLRIRKARRGELIVTAAERPFETEPYSYVAPHSDAGMEARPS